MFWILAAVVALGLGFAVWRVLGANLLGRRRPQSETDHWIRSLLHIMEDGGVLTLSDRASTVRLELSRHPAGSEDAAYVEIRILRTKAAELGRDRIGEAWKRLDLEEVAPDPHRGEAVATGRLHVLDIWDEWAGAKAARAVELSLRALSIDEGERMDFDLVGNRVNRLSSRMKRREARGLPPDVL